MSLRGSLVRCVNARPEVYSGLKLGKYYLIDTHRIINGLKLEITIREIDGTRVKWKNDSQESTFYSGDRFQGIDLDSADRAVIIETISWADKKPLTR